MAIILILGFTMLFMWAALVLNYRMDAVENGKYLLGITLPAQYRKEEAVRDIMETYRHGMKRISAVGLLLCLPILMVNGYFSFSVLFLMVWFMLLASANQRNVMRCAHRLYQLKQEKGWFSGNPHVVRIDTVLSRIRDRGTVSGWWLAPAVLLGAAGCLLFWQGYGGMAAERDGAERAIRWVGIAVLAGAEPLMVLAYAGIRHARCQVYCSDTDANQKLDRTMRYEWSRCIVLHAWGMALLALYVGWQSGAGRSYFQGGGMAAVFLLLLCAVGSFWSLYCAYDRVKSVKEQIIRCLAGRDAELYGDDDEYWLNGYPAGKRPSGLTEKRIGVGWTISASAQGDITDKAVLALIGIFTVGICLFLAPYDFAQVTMEIEDGQCRVRAASMGYSFDLEDVESVTLEQERPAMSKKSGYDSNRFFLGDFRVRGFGTCKVFLSLKNKQVIRVDMRDGILWFNSESLEETMQFYERLNGAASHF